MANDFCFNGNDPDLPFSTFSLNTKGSLCVSVSGIIWGGIALKEFLFI